MNQSNYYGSYNETGNRKEYLKHGLLNEFGYNIYRKERECYDEEKIIKKVCNLKESKKGA